MLSPSEVLLGNTDSTEVSTGCLLAWSPDQDKELKQK
jgi:uncharacterized protein (AIM24 family)